MRHSGIVFFFDDTPYMPCTLYCTQRRSRVATFLEKWCLDILLYIHGVMSVKACKDCDVPEPLRSNTVNTSMDLSSFFSIWGTGKSGRMTDGCLA